MEQSSLDQAIIYIIHIRLMRKLEEEIRVNIDTIYWTISDSLGLGDFEKWYEGEYCLDELSCLKDLLKLKLKWIKTRNELSSQINGNSDEMLKNLSEVDPESPKYMLKCRR